MSEVKQDGTSEDPVPRRFPTHDFGFIPIPKRLRYNPKRPAELGLILNMVFGACSTFTVANLYYSQPMLILLSQSFGVSYDRISRVPTLVQGGYGAGILLVSPLGDLVRRRQLLLLIITISTLLTIGLATTHSLVAFEILCFFIGVSSCAPQILVPLAADLAPPHKRASAISIVISGLLLGVLFSRVMSGVVAQYVTWRVVYAVACGLQVASLLALWMALPDFPSKAKKGTTYVQIMKTMFRLAATEPVLVQVCLAHVAGAAFFTNFWVTLTYLLGDNPYQYGSTVIGLFGLIGFVGVCCSPIYGRVIDKLVPWHVSVAMSVGLLLTFSLYWGAAGVTLAAPVLVTLGLDVFRQSQQVSLATRIFMLDDGLRSRLNACAMFSICIGQTIGSAAGSKVFLDYGWRANGALMVAFCGCQLFVLLSRGPHAERYTWFGYEGGLEWRRERPSPVQDAELSGTKRYDEGKSGEQTRAPSLDGDDKDVVFEEDKGPLSESQTRAPSPSTQAMIEERKSELT
ncbi:MFS general substrate transporter [Peniophora sp. CONT]|nr:MFS general substrate transporter [Peniophora sp. CONT]